MSKTTKRVLVGLVILAVVLYGVKRYNDGKTKGITRVSTEKVALRSITETVTASGKIYPENEVRISPEFSGQVNDLKVSEGDKVKKGQVLASISNRGAITSPIDGMVTSLKVKKGETVAGNTFSVGSTMMTIADMSSLELRVGVGENDIVKISVGDSADVEVDAYNNRKFKGVVSQIANTTNERMPSMGAGSDITEYEVKIKLDTSSYKDLVDSAAGTSRQPFRPGMNASASIRTRKVDQAITVPITAINARVKGSDKSMEDRRQEEKENKGNDDIQDPNEDMSEELEEVAFVLQKDGRVKKVIVQSGIQDMNYIEVLKGLQAGDEVITGPYTALSKDLKDGTKVKVVAKDKLFEK